MSARARLVAASLLALMASCGSRSELEVPYAADEGRRDAGPVDAGSDDAGRDAGPRDGGAPIELCSRSLMGGVAGESPFGPIDLQVVDVVLADCCGPFPGGAFMAFEGARGQRLELAFAYDADCSGATGRQVRTDGVRSQTMDARFIEADGTEHALLVRADWVIGELREVPPLGPHTVSIRGQIGSDEWDAVVVIGGGFCEWAFLLC